MLRNSVNWGKAPEPARASGACGTRPTLRRRRFLFGLLIDPRQGPELVEPTEPVTVVAADAPRPAAEALELAASSSQVLTRSRTVSGAVLDEAFGDGRVEVRLDRLEDGGLHFAVRDALLLGQRLQ